MSLLEVVNLWIHSIAVLLERVHVSATHVMSEPNIAKPSCAINLRRGKLEADLVLWNSGEAELALVGPEGVVEQEHLELSDPQTLTTVLDRMLRTVA
jgi:hypothetical protein